jgi:hypothetical protein
MTRRRAWALVLAVAGGLALVLAAVVLPRIQDDPLRSGSVGEERDDTPSASPGPSDGVAPEVAPTTGLDEVILGDHAPGIPHTQADVDYTQTPPLGGAHDPAWLECGAYDEPVRDENAVHSLEHGTVWITHDPDLPAEDVDALAGALPEKGILSPYPDLPAPVVVSVWNRQLRLTGADDPRLAQFVDEFGDGSTAPEPFASCRGGVGGERAEPVLHG